MPSEELDKVTHFISLAVTAALSVGGMLMLRPGVGGVRPADTMPETLMFSDLVEALVVVMILVVAATIIVGIVRRRYGEVVVDV